MKLSELIERLQNMQRQFGDKDVILGVQSNYPLQENLGGPVYDHDDERVVILASGQVRDEPYGKRGWWDAAFHDEEYGVERPAEYSGYHQFVNENGDKGGSFEVWYNDGTTFDPEDNAALPGWYWWAHFPGCLPDSEPEGPCNDAKEAWEAAIHTGG